MEKQKNDVYNNVAITFITHSGSVTGVLNGTDKQWSFDSDSPAFLKMIPSGKLLKINSNIAELPSGIAELVNHIHRAAEDLGYSMHLKL